MIGSDVQSRIGVLITYHNEGAALTECLASLAADSDHPDEIWIYDDASEILPANYIPAGLDVRIIRGEVTKGPAVGRNLLLTRCGCDYVHFQDADDLFAPDWLSIVRQSIQQFRPDVVFTEIAACRDGHFVCNQSQQLRKLANEGDLLRFCIRCGLWTEVGTYLRKKVEEMCGYDEHWLAEDYDFHIRFATLRPHYQIIFDPLIITGSHKSGRSSDRRRICMDVARYLKQLRCRLPADYQQDISEELASLGAELYQSGARSAAAELFAMSREIAAPKYEGRPLAYRSIAAVMGPNCAEWCRVRFLSALPRMVREQVQRNLGLEWSDTPGCTHGHSATRDRTV